MLKIKHGKDADTEIHVIITTSEGSKPSVWKILVATFAIFVIGGVSSATAYGIATKDYAPLKQIVQASVNIVVAASEALAHSKDK